MFLNETTEQWTELLEYFILMFILFAVIVVISCIIYNKFLYKKNKIKVKKLEKKSYFIDVA